MSKDFEHLLFGGEVERDAQRSRAEKEARAGEPFEPLEHAGMIRKEAPPLGRISDDPRLVELRAMMQKTVADFNAALDRLQKARARKEALDPPRELVHKSNHHRKR